MKVQWYIVRNAEGQPRAAFAVKEAAEVWRDTGSRGAYGFSGPHPLDLPDAPRSLDVIARELAELAVVAHMQRRQIDVTKLRDEYIAAKAQVPQ